MIKVVFKPSYAMGTNCYAISDGKHYVIVDPAVSYYEMDSLCKGEIKGVLITHGHFDHIQELQSYLDNTNVNVYGHKNTLDKLQNSSLNCSSYFGNDLLFECNDRFISVASGENIELLDEKIVVIENFGHTNCSVSYIIENNMFCGDFIFAGSIGRTDLPTASFEEMKKSLDNLRECGENYKLYPGHGSQTSLLAEKNRNLYLRD